VHNFDPVPSPWSYRKHSYEMLDYL
jgi:hypothetical protein